MSFRKRLIAGVVAASIGFSGLATVIILGPKSPEEDQALAATDSPARATLTMGVSSNADALTPGADLTFGLTLGCDAPEEPGCIGAVLTDDIPAFLQVTDIDVLTEDVTVDIVSDGKDDGKVEIAFTTPLSDTPDDPDAPVGLVHEQPVQIAITTMLDPDLDPDLNGFTLTNEAFLTTDPETGGNFEEVSFINGATISIPSDDGGDAEGDEQQDKPTASPKPSEPGDTPSPSEAPSSSTPDDDEPTSSPDPSDPAANPDATDGTDNTGSPDPAPSPAPADPTTSPSPSATPAPSSNPEPSQTPAQSPTPAASATPAPSDTPAPTQTSNPGSNANAGANDSASNGLSESSNANAATPILAASPWLAFAAAAPAPFDAAPVFPAISIFGTGVLAADATITAADASITATGGFLPDPSTTNGAVGTVTKQAPPSAGNLKPGDCFDYTLAITCSALDADGCAGAQLNDAVPPPLVVSNVTVSPAGSSSPPYFTGNDVNVTFTDSFSGGPGLDAGSTVEVKITVCLPADAPVDFNGKTITNEGWFEGDNFADSSDTADAKPSIPSQAGTEAIKDFNPGTAVTAKPGQDVGMNIGGTNTSNGSGTLVIQDPAGPGNPTNDSKNPFYYLDMGTVGALTCDDGVTRTPKIEYFGGTAPGAWSGTQPSPVWGIRVTIPGVPAGVTCTLPVDTTTNNNVTKLDPSKGIDNQASSDVTMDTCVPGTCTAHATDNANQPLLSNDISVGITKGFKPNVITAGTSSTVGLAVTNNGTQSLDGLTVYEPSSYFPPVGTGLDDRLTFDGFGAINYPPSSCNGTNITSASVTFYYADGSSETVSFANGGTPAPTAPHTNADVVAFEVHFDGTIGQGCGTNVPFDVVANEDIKDMEVVPNEACVTGTLSGSSDADACDDDNLFIYDDVVNTYVGKEVNPGQIFDNPGEGVLVGLTGGTQPYPSGPGAEDGSFSTGDAPQVILQDPNDPGNSEWWDYFDLTGIVGTPVPACATLTVQRYDTTTGTWVDWSGGNIPLTGPGTANATFPDSLKDTTGGIRFIYTYNTGAPGCDAEGFPPGTNFAPNYTAELRPDHRGDGTPIVIGDDGQTIENIATSGTGECTPAEIADPNNTDCDNPGDLNGPDGPGEIPVLPLPDGPGNMIDKNFGASNSFPSLTDPTTVYERSGDTFPLTIGWSTGGLSGYDTVAITDMTPVPTSSTDLANSFFDAFNLTGIRAITPAQDPYMKYDAVAAVEYWDGSVWQPLGPCNASPANYTTAGVAPGGQCDGKMPAVSLTAAQQAAAQAIRIVFVESPTRQATLNANNQFLPTVGSGVARSDSNSRPITMDWVVRDTKRSDGSPVLAKDVYNTSSNGLVNNVAGLEACPDNLPLGNGGCDTDQDSDTVLIKDIPLTTTTTKTITPDTVAIPNWGGGGVVPPTIRTDITTTNTTPGYVDTLQITDPVNYATDGVGDYTDAFDTFDISNIVAISPPAGADNSKTEVFLKCGAGNEVGPFTTAQVMGTGGSQLLGEQCLLSSPAGVAGIRVVFHGGRIAPGAKAKLTFDMRLRQNHRGDGSAVTVADAPIWNRAEGQVADVDPPGTCPNPLKPTDPGYKRYACGDGTDNVGLDEGSFGLSNRKTLTPASQKEGDYSPVKVLIGATPTGTTAPVSVTVEDDDPTFWNEFNFAGAVIPGTNAPVRYIQACFLSGGTFSNATVVASDPGTSNLTTLVADPQQPGLLPSTGGGTPDDGTNNSGTASGVGGKWTCQSISDLTASTNAGDSANRAAAFLQNAMGVLDITGVRFTSYTTSFGAWANPIHAEAYAYFNVVRRHCLRSSGTDDPNDAACVPVPTTEYGQTMAPGEDNKTTVSPGNGIYGSNAVGVTRNTMSSHGESVTIGQGDRLTADNTASANYTYDHLRTSVNVGKTPNGQKFTPGSLITYTLTYTNNGERPITDPVFTDNITPVDGVCPLMWDPDQDPTVPPWSFGLSGTATTNGGPDLPTAAGSWTADDPLSVGDCRVSFTPPSGTVLEVGQTLTITLTMMVRPGVEAHSEISNDAEIDIAGPRDPNTGKPLNPPPPLDTCNGATVPWTTPANDSMYQCDYDVTNTLEPGTAIAAYKAVKADVPPSTLTGVTPTKVPGDVMVRPDYLVSGGGTIPDAQKWTYCLDKADDAGYYRNPCVPVTIPGDTETWKFDIENVGTMPVTQLVSVDVLPYVGDKGVIVQGDRLTEWHPIFTGTPVLVVKDANGNTVSTGTLTVDYSSGVAVCAAGKQTPGSPNTSACGLNDWAPLTSTGDNPDVLSLRFTMNFDAALAPGQTAEIQFQTRTLPEDLAPDGWPIAWNTVATSGTATDPETGQDTALGATEVRKVGVTYPAGELDLSKMISGAGWNDENRVRPNYEAWVTCWIENGLNGSGYNAGVDELLNVPGNPYLLKPPNPLAPNTPGPIQSIKYLPFGAHCVVAEENTNREGTIYAPPSTLTPDQCPPVGDSWNGTEGLGVAGCSGEVIVGSPTYRPDVTLSVNNVYGESNATLTKSVDSDAVDQNGQPIKYGPFDFEIMCWQRDLDTQVLKNTLSDFHAPSCNPATTDCPPLWLPGQVKDGQTIATLEVIPPESYCEIREVNWATGLQTDWGATYDESPVGKGLTGDPWQQDGNTYSFPAWDVDPSQIDNTATPVPWPPGTITPGSDSRRIGFWTPLAQCGSDTQASDASQPNFCQEPPLAFTADNIMGDGMLTVTKDREGDGVSPYGNGPFDFHVVCTLDTDGVSTTPPVTVWQGDFTLPSGDPSLDTSWTWSQDHIATGASCTITETNTAGATTVAFDQNPVIIGDHGNPDAIPPIPANNPEVTVTVTNTFDAGALRINKKFTGDGGTLWGQGPWPDGTTPTYTVTSVCWTGGGNAPKPDLSNVIPPYLYGGPKFVLSAANNWDVVLSPLPDGAKCLFTETDQGGAQSVAISPNPVTVDGSHNCPTTITAAAETQEATNPSSPFADAGLTLVNTITVNDPSTCNPVDLNVTNEFTLGEIDVTKTVSGSASGLMNSNTEFEITLFCSYGGKTVNVPNSPATIKAGQTVKFTDLPTGTTCLIVETDSQGAQTTSVNPQFVTVGKSNTVKVAIDNTFDVGSLTINKLITGDDQAISDADADSTTFWVKLDCVWSGTPNPDGTPGPFPVPGSLWRQFKPGSPAVFKGLPIGAVCTISEGQFGQTSTTITPNPVTISSDPKRNVVIVTNDYQPSTLQIEKMVPTADTNPAYGNRPLDQDGNPIPYGPFELRLQCWKTEADYENWVATGNADLYPPIKDESVYVFDRPTTNSHWNVWDVAGVLPNSACLLTEFNRAGADDVQMMVRIDGDKGATWSDGDSLHFTMPESAVPVNVYVQNDYDSGSLTINKAIDGYGADAWGNGPFTFHVKCVADTGQGLTTVWDGNVTLGGDTSQAPWSTTIDHIALNAICTVTETGDGGANSTAVTTGDGSGVKPGATNEAQVAIVDATGSGPEVSVSFTNTFEVAGFSVTKEVMGPAAEDHLTDVFTAHVTCRYGLGSKAGQVIDTADLPDPYLFPDGSLQVAQNPSGSADYPLQPGQTLQFHDLPKGARCVLTEADDGGASSHWVNDITAGKPGVPANTSKPDQANITVGKDPLAAYQVDNSFGTGDLEVKKVIAGPGAGLYGAGPFEVTLSCVKDGQTVAPDSYGGAVRTLSAPDYSTKYGPFLPGTICTLKETETAGAHVVEYVPSPASNADQSASGEVTIEQDKTVGIRATNTYQVGSVEVTKTLSGTGADKYAPDSFTVKLACTWNGKSVSIPGGATRKIVAGKPVTYKNLPTGAECVLTETGSSGADAITYSPADAQNAKRARVVVGDGKAVSITVDNRFNNPTPPGGNPPGSGPYRPGGWQTITGVSATILLTAALTALLGVVFVTRPGLQTVPQRAGGRGRHRA